MRKNSTAYLPGRASGGAAAWLLAAIAVLAVFTASAPTNAAAWCPEVCSSSLVPLRILFIGDLGIQFRNQLTLPDCDSCTMVEGVDFTFVERTFLAARGETPGFFLGFDVIVFGGMNTGTVFGPYPWESLLATTRRAAITGFHLDLHNDEVGFRRLS
jgi:hypothetical protein